MEDLEDLFGHCPAPPEASSGKVVISRNVDLGSFGNLCLLIVVSESTVRAVTFLECNDENIEYFNYLS